MSGEVWLLASVKSIQSVIFESNRLVQMRGGSRLLRRLDDSFNAAAAPHGAITEIVGGGQFRFRLPDRASAEVLATRLRQKVEEELGLPGHRLRTVVKPAGEAAARGLAYAALGHGTQLVGLPSADCGLVASCASCRLRPAMATVNLPDGESQQVCGVCRRRHEAGQRLEAEDLWEQLDLPDEPTSDLTTFARGARPENYVAVVAVDGDRIGALLRSVDDDTALSRHLADAMRAAVWEAAGHAEERVRLDEASSIGDGATTAGGGPATAHRLRPMLPQWIGGDDAVLVLHPQHAFRVTTELLRVFAHRMASAGHPVTASAGIAIAHASLPMHQFVGMAEELLDEAKRVSRAYHLADAETEGVVVGFVDVELVAESFADHLSERRSQSSRAAMPVYADPDATGGADHLHRCAVLLLETEAGRASVHRWADGDPDHGLHDEVAPRLPADNAGRASVAALYEIGRRT
jgi:hypothetical protein